MTVWQVRPTQNEYITTPVVYQAFQKSLMSCALCTHLVVKVPILQHLESLRDEELEERREKRRRQLAEEEETAKQNESSSAGEETREQSLQVGERTYLQHELDSGSIKLGRGYRY